MPDIANNTLPHNSLREFCAQQAALFRAGKPLTAAVDSCWHHAVARGWDAVIGVNAVQEIMARAFAEVRDDL